jgi:hypothetical protein
MMSYPFREKPPQVSFVQRDHEIQRYGHLLAEHRLTSSICRHCLYLRSCCGTLRFLAPNDDNLFLALQDDLGLPPILLNVAGNTDFLAPV